MRNDKRRRVLANELRPRFARLSQALRREAANSALTTTQTAVLGLLMLGRPLRISDLARAEGVTMPTMTQVIKRMVDAKLVTRAAPAGTYNNLVQIADLGRKLAEEVAATRNAALEERLGRLSPEDYQTLFDAIPLIDLMFEREPWTEPQPRQTNKKIA
jgi:DNA-binding MarR family transcriptional regulator